MGVTKYAFLGVILGAVILGAYYSGYRVGQSTARIEYVTKEVEVVKYVEAKRSEIYSAPAASVDTLVRLFNKGEL